MKVAIVIASVGRPQELARWADHCRRQTLTPCEIVFSIASDADLPAGFHDNTVTVLRGPKGSSHQRNSGLNALTSAPDVVAFFDDDYVPSRRCLEGIARVFEAHPELVGTTGRLLADGIHSAGIDFETASAMIARFDAEDAAPNLVLNETLGTYGCNMAFRWSVVKDVRFDERLPLYAWQEDVDFSRRLRDHGVVARTEAFVGVHQGVKGGRTAGQKFGYSQIANPLYLIRKGTMPARDALWLMTRNMASNHAKAFRPEPWIDRKGRAEGNWRALKDLVTGRLQPERILEF
ncbi:glycosyltransferase family 2 protein [Sphingomonas carotinifaciens]|uniref:Glycosyltransferase n=1 Tax=Sphingomonas carotinifaciens TaxID=1166323 RepID=A0A1G7QT74_9SPHN|nr:glycosyltransferase [Sphingomonas carotinifaciens]MBB4087821.1 GT2 family glycosyltransferase [Sphingomonas carotinifaciens]MWC42343.1 glycosyltransferase [Sphingomonas carotinifaciens]SDG01683.1 Glycosyltransferase, GT2 family [Sphingomonas carotinifaciens]